MRTVRECTECGEREIPDFHYVIGGFVWVDGEVLCESCWGERKIIRKLLDEAASAEADR